MQLINSTVIRELSTTIFPGAYIRGPISKELIAGAYNQGAYIGGLITGCLYPGGIYPPGLTPGVHIQGIICGGL